MGKSNFESEKVLDQLSEDTIPETSDPQEDNDISSKDASSQAATSFINSLHSSFEAGHLDNTSSCAAVQVNDPAELFVVRIEPSVTQGAALPQLTSADIMFAQPAASSNAFAPLDIASDSPMEESISDSVDPPAFASASVATPGTAVVESWPLELGAEVVCCQGDSTPVKRAGETARESWASKSLPVPNIPPVERVILSRHVSYEEVVHREMNPGEEGQDQRELFAKTNSREKNVGQSFLIVTQWALTLQAVYEDRSRMGLLSLNKFDRATKCVCHKAQAIVQQLVQVESCFATVIEEKCDLPKLLTSLNEMQETLRMNVSIQISNPGREIVSRALDVLGTIGDCRTYVQDALLTIAKFVNALLLVKFCRLHSKLIGAAGGLMEQDEEGDIRSRVASLMSEDKPSSSSSSRDGDDVTMNDEDSSSENPEKQQSGGRKRKQIFPKLICPVSPNGGNSPLHFGTAPNSFSLNGIRSTRRTPPTSPTSSSSPSKRPRRLSRPTVTSLSSTSSSPFMMMSPSGSASTSPSSSPALDLLETKKKGQKSGLYQWVLWREALKGEKDRRAANSPRSASPTPVGVATMARPPPIQRSSDKSSWRKLFFT